MRHSVFFFLFFPFLGNVFLPIVAFRHYPAFNGVNQRVAFKKGELRFSVRLFACTVD